jgi:hypothetical protein
VLHRATSHGPMACEHALTRGARCARMMRTCLTDRVVGSDARCVDVARRRSDEAVLRTHLALLTSACERIVCRVRITERNSTPLSSTTSRSRVNLVVRPCPHSPIGAVVLMSSTAVAAAAASSSTGSVLSRPAAASSSLFFADALFSQLGLDTRLWKALASAHMSRLTLVQQSAIPHMLQGANVLVQAKTGSGKTLAYAIPLVIIDHFTRYAIVVPTQSQEAEVVAMCLVDEVYNRYGTPRRLLSDRGSNFMSAICRTLHGKLHVKTLFTSANHPQCNGMVERLNATLKETLYTLSGTYGNQWVQVLQAAAFAYNTSKSEATGFTPYYLMYGREALTPGDALAVAVGQADIDVDMTVPDYVALLTSNIEECHRFVKTIFESKAEQVARDRLAIAHIPVYKVGDKVWMANAKLSATGAQNVGRIPPWVGPCTVKEKLSDTNYVLAVPVTKKKRGRNETVTQFTSSSVHSGRMKPYSSRPPDVPPTTQPPAIEDLSSPHRRHHRSSAAVHRPPDPHRISKPLRPQHHLLQPEHHSEFLPTIVRRQGSLLSPTRTISRSIWMRRKQPNPTTKVQSQWMSMNPTFRLTRR